MKKIKSSNNIGIAYMVKKIYPMCFKAKPLNYILIQLANILTGLSNGLDLLITQIFFDTIYNIATGEATLTSAFIALGIYAWVKLTAYILEGARQYAIEVHGSRVMGYMMSLIHKKSAQIDPIMYEDPAHLEDINKAANGTDAAIYFNSVTSFIFTYHLPYFGFLLWYLSSLKPILILCLLFIFIPVVVSHFFRSSLISKLEDKSAPFRRKYDAYSNACCGKDFYKETRTLGAFKYLKGLLSSSIDALNEAVWGTQKKVAYIDFAFNSLTLLGYGGVLFLSVKCLLDGDISVGAFAAVFSSIDTLFSSMEYFIGSHLGSIAENFGEIRNFLRFLQIPSNCRSNIKIDKKRGITLQNVSFRYPNSSVSSLRNINLTLNPGETVALVGDNGAGKSTLIKVLIGIYSPSEGSVMIGGENLKNADYNMVFKGISGVFQKYQKYALTLNENVAISDFNVSPKEDRIRKALKEVHIDVDDDLLFPKGTETMLSREFDGVDLSGGQWQRIAIARGLYRDSDIVVLDEPTAAIDPIEETKIYKEFAMLAKDKTAVIVTHRMGSARIADRIIVMKNGEIAESGTHSELMLKKGVYAEMFNVQARWY